MADDDLTGEAADWAKSTKDNLAEDVKHRELLIGLGIEPEKLWGKGLHFRVTPPSWLAATPVAPSDPISRSGRSI